MKKVLVFRSRLLGYSETFIRDQVRSLPNWCPVLVGEGRARNSLDLSDLEHVILKPKAGGKLVKIIWKVARFLHLPPPGVIKRLRAEKANLVHVHFGLDAVRFESILDRLALPVVITLHGYDINRRKEWWESGKGRNKNRRYPERLIALARRPNVRFVAISSAIREAAIRFGLPAEKVQICHIGVDTERYYPAGDPLAKRHPRVLFVGRLAENKGCTYLIEACARLKLVLPQAELIVVGDGRLKQQLEAQAVEAGLNVRFLGALSSNDVKKQMDLARVVCLPSVTVASGDSEGFGMVLLEAQACGVPVVTSSKGGIDALVDGVTGFYHRERDVDAITRALITLLGDDETATRFGAAGREFVCDRFDINRCSARLEDVYDRALEASTLPRTTNAG